MKDGFQTDLLGNLLLKMSLVLVKTILYSVSLCFHAVSLNTKTVTISNIWLFPKNGFSLRLSFFIAKLITTNCDSSLQETYSVLFVGKRTESLRTSSHNCDRTGSRRTSSHNYDRIESHN